MAQQDSRGPGEEIVETAKAVQEVAKTAGKAVDGSRELGGFLREVFGELIINAVGIPSDWLANYREERLLILRHKTHERLRSRGVTATMPLSPKVAVPLIENASLENDNDLMDMWSNLLANSLDPNCSVSAQKYQVEILSQLGPAEAALLHILWLSSEAGRESETDKKDATKAHVETEKQRRWRRFSASEKKMAIHNLIRLRLANFSRERLPTDHLFMDERTRKTKPFVNMNPMSNDQLNLHALDRVIKAIDWEIMTSSGWMEPNVFQTSEEKPEKEQYDDPERGLHLIASGWFLMKACQSSGE